MTAICPRCSRPNPTGARYCHHDGIALAGAASGPLDIARQPFPAPFVFPSGAACRNFDELAVACERHWSEAAELLRQGYLQQFLNFLGRADLALAAEQAAHSPDRDRGLDQLLARLPAPSLAPPRLDVQPPQVLLAALAVGQDYQFTLELRNAGGRLVSGSITADCDWLALAERGASRLIQFTRTLTVPVRVVGRCLRAGAKPLEGKLILETNAGSAVVRVAAPVPARPFGEGVLAGACTPRELAKKAMAAPRAAAPLFESGAVACWYQANGWSYPVPGPAASGLAAVQQFFEALGLTAPPRVELSEPQLRLRGAPGARLHEQVMVYTSEGRPVYAHGEGSEPWLAAGRAVCRGTVATVPIEVTVPSRPGEEVRAIVRVVANGGQRFDVPVTILVEAAAPAARQASPAPAPPPPAVQPPAASPAPARSGWRDLLPVGVLGLLLLGLVIADFLRDLPRPQQVAVREETAFAVQIQDEPDEGPAGAAAFKIEDEPEERVGNAPPAPVKVEIKDEPAEGGPAAPIDPTPLVKYALRSPNGLPLRPELTDNRTGPNTASPPNLGIVMPLNPLSFGVSATDAAGTARNKLLTWSANGHSNSTVVRLDGAITELGGNRGRVVRMAVPDFAEGIKPTPGAASPAQTTWVVGGDANGDGGLRFHQVFEVVPGQVTTVGGAPRRRLDTVLVRWVIENRQDRGARVGLRLHMDTLIGSNDGVPFTVPGQPGLVSTSADFRRPEDVPDFVQALENPNLQSPGTIAHLTTKVGSGLEPPDRLSLTYQAFWGLGFDPIKNWDYPIHNMGNDSAVVLYWSDRNLRPGEKRAIGFAYGLGQLTSSARLGVTLGGSFEPGKNFTVTAYVKNRQPDQTLRLDLPEGLRLVEGAATQTVPPAAAGGTSLVTWKARVERTGTFRLTVHSSTGQSQAKTLAIARPDGGKLALDLSGSFAPGQAFDVAAKLTPAAPGQTLTLQLPPGLQRVEGEEVQAADGMPVRWRVRVLKAGKFPVRVVSSTGIAQAKTLTVVQPGAAASNFRIALKGDFAPGRTFTVSAEVSHPAPGQTLTLQLPAGLQRVEGGEVQRVPEAAVASLSWQVKVLRAGKFPVRVASSTGVVQRKDLRIEEPGGAGRFRFDLVGDIRPSKEFEVAAKVAEPVAGQTLTLVLPDGLQLVEGAVRQAVGPTAAVTWRVRVVSSGRLPVRVESSTGLVRTKTITLTQSTDSTLFGR